MCCNLKIWISGNNFRVKPRLNYKLFVLQKFPFLHEQLFQYFFRFFFRTYQIVEGNFIKQLVNGVLNHLPKRPCRTIN